MKKNKKKTINITSFAAKFQFLPGSIAFYPQARELPPGRCCRGGQGKPGAWGIERLLRSIKTYRKNCGYP